MCRSRRAGGYVLRACRGCVWEGGGNEKSSRGLAGAGSRVPTPLRGNHWEVLRFKGESEKCEVRAEKVAWRLSQPHEGLSERV